MTTDLSSRAMPQEWWERLRDGARARLAAFVQARPGLVTAVGRSKAWILWAASTWSWWSRPGRVAGPRHPR